MKLMAPLSDHREVIPLIRAGADEFYCGIIPENWRSQYGSWVSPNCHFGKANFYSYADLEQAVNKAGRHGARIFVVFNAQNISETQFGDIKKLALSLESRGVSGFIVSSAALVLYLRRNCPGLIIHLSVQAGVFNPAAAEYFTDMGVERIILSEHLTLKQLSGIALSSKAEVEIFVKNNLCRNLEALCSFAHGTGLKPMQVLLNNRFIDNLGYKFLSIVPEVLKKYFLNSRVSNIVMARHGCNMQYSIFPESARGAAAKYTSRKIRSFTDYYYFSMREKSACGACGIFRSANSGIKIFKIDGRHMPMKLKVRDTGFIKACIKQVEASESEDDFIRWCVGHHKRVYGYKCRLQQCYFPELWRRAWKKPGM